GGNPRERRGEIVRVTSRGAGMEDPSHRSQDEAAKPQRGSEHQEPTLPSSFLPHLGGGLMVTLPDWINVVHAIPPDRIRRHSCFQAPYVRCPRGQRSSGITPVHHVAGALPPAVSSRGGGAPSLAEFNQ